jgi:predicted RNA-binding protein
MSFLVRLKHPPIGVVNADKQTSPGDEFIIAGLKTFGIGSSKMSGWEMVQLSKGMAAELKKIEKI